MSWRCRRAKHETEPHPVAGYLTGGGPSSPRRPVMLSNLIESFTVCARTRFAKSTFLLALALLAVFTAALPSVSFAQSGEPTAAAAPAAAPAETAAPAAAAAPVAVAAAVAPAAAPALDAKA